MMAIFAASYLLVDESDPSVRRAEYDVNKELRALANCGLSSRRVGRELPQKRSSADAGGRARHSKQFP